MTTRRTTASAAAALAVVLLLQVLLLATPSAGHLIIYGAPFCRRPVTHDLCDVCVNVPLFSRGYEYIFHGKRALYYFQEGCSGRPGVLASSTLNCSGVPFESFKIVCKPTVAAG